MANNRKINWIPPHLKEGRMGEWLQEVKDWAFSRERYWGTPLPIWECTTCQKNEVIGSVKELFSKKLLQNPYKNKKEIDLHRPFVDKVEFACAKCLASPDPAKRDKPGELVVRLGRFGKFYACSKFPECKHTEPLEEHKPKSLEISCPKCKKGEIVAKPTRRGKVFYGCNRYPECDFALWDKPTKETCKECAALMVEKGKDKTKCSNKECKSSKT